MNTENRQTSIVMEPILTLVIAQRSKGLCIPNIF